MARQDITTILYSQGALEETLYQIAPGSENRYNYS